MRQRLLVVEDEASMLRVLELQLSSAGYQVAKASSAEEALKVLASGNVDLILTDLKLPGVDGLELLRRVRGMDSSLPVIMMTAFGTVETAVQAMKAGANDYVLKPFALDDLMITIEKVLELCSLRDENERLKDELGRRYQFENIIGRSPKMQEVFAAVARVAPTRATVLLVGESGIGKDLIARAIHHHSPRHSRPFVKISCSAIPENLMESELFGYEKGAFTGAMSSRVGKFEQADGGTVFLDEIGDVPTTVQVKLLRVLQEREFERLGSNKTILVDVRVIAATNQDLQAALETGAFREDLYYRLNVVPIAIPPLRERKQDLPLLVAHFLEKYREDTGGRALTVTPAAMDKLGSYHWPGNVRELENIMQRAMVMVHGNTIDAADIRLDTERRAAPSPDGVPFLPEGYTLDQYEQELIREALRRTGGNKWQAARLLGLTRSALRYRLKQMGVEA
jgi:DNA-binding NtrC family response regulator